jgi:hypothetical protein
LLRTLAIFEGHQIGQSLQAISASSRRAVAGAHDHHRRRRPAGPAHAGTGATWPPPRQRRGLPGRPCRPRLRAPHHPPQAGKQAAGVRQIGRPRARPGPRLGAIGQHGRQQLSQIIGRGGHRRGWGGGAAAGFPGADKGGRGGPLEQAQGPAAGTVGHQLGGHHPAQLLSDRGRDVAAVPAGPGSGGRGGGQGLGQAGRRGGLQPERIGPSGQGWGQASPRQRRAPKIGRSSGSGVVPP